MTVDVVRGQCLAVPHGFLGRRGGVSRGEMWGLNVGPGSGDDAEALRENQRRAVAAVLPGASLTLAHQVHSADVLSVEQSWPLTNRPAGDALVTDRPGIILGVLTADCAPVLFADAEAGVVGAAHAGWRGALGGITDATIEAMEKLGARRERMSAAVGPCIARKSYEVDEAFRERFLVQDEATDCFFSRTPGERPHFDLEAYVAYRLRSAGLAQVETLDLDTYADAERYFSYRRATHLGEAAYGRQVSLIGLA
ncbi:MAG: peptidoglycan editing factor PgeF [Sphingomicrobium sp.]